MTDDPQLIHTTGNRFHCEHSELSAVKTKKCPKWIEFGIHGKKNYSAETVHDRSKSVDIHSQFDRLPYASGSPMSARISLKKQFTWVLKTSATTWTPVEGPLANKRDNSWWTYFYSLESCSRCGHAEIKLMVDSTSVGFCWSVQTRPTAGDFYSV